jgi:hypothetical protein
MKSLIYLCKLLWSSKKTEGRLTLLDLAFPDEGLREGKDGRFAGSEAGPEVK